MEFIPVSNTAKVFMSFLWNNQYVGNVFNMKKSAAWSEEDLQLLAAGMVDWWANQIKQYVPNTVSLIEVFATSLESQDAPGITYSTGLPILGSGAGAGLPNNVSIAVKWTTGLRGRAYRGRTYHIGVLASAVTGSTASSTYCDNLRNGYDNLIAGEGISVTCHIAVVSRQLNKVARTTGVATDVTACSVDQVVDSQRRRLPGRGR